MYTELGLSYNYMKRTFDSLDNVENQGTTLSVSLYLWEKIALELSYTNGLYVKKERESSYDINDNSQRTTTQWSDISEANLIYVFAERTATFQPYVKGGGAYIKKKQVVQIDNDAPSPAIIDAGWGPSAGIGIKMMISDSLSIRASYDVVHTPIDNSTAADDITGRVGISWIF